MTLQRSGLLVGLLLVAIRALAADLDDGTEGGISSFEMWKFILSILGYLGALTAFLIGLRQYRRADYWRRSEFLAKDIKDFFDGPKVSTALTLVDWAARYVNIGVKDSDATAPHRGDETLVDRALQCSALRPHTMTKAGSPAANQVGKTSGSADVVNSGKNVTPSDSVSSTGSPAIGGAAFSLEEAAIRDHYDKLLDGFERYGNYLQGRLVSKADLESYLGYWIRDIVSLDCDKTDALWSFCLLSYIDFYAFLGVQALFREFGHDIEIEGRLAQDFLEKSSDSCYATALRTLVKAEKERNRPARAPADG